MSRSMTALGAGLLAMGMAAAAAAQDPVRRLPVREYRDRMKAGWIGQIIGVSWGAPTEGKFHAIIPKEKMPPFREGLVNEAFDQDDLYVEMTFLRSMEQYGLDVPIRQAGIDFADSGYALWVANEAGRRNLRNGIAPPDSSHPKFHNCAGAIDYQIEADYSGLIAPGMPDIVIALGEKFGRLMNYGDGVYAGQFMGVLYAEAFFEKDVLKLIDAGLRSIPKESMYAGMVRDMLRWHEENPGDWAKTWELAVRKYDKDRNYNISELDVKREGAMVLLGLLYGAGGGERLHGRGDGADRESRPGVGAGEKVPRLGAGARGQGFGLPSLEEEREEERPGPAGGGEGDGGLGPLAEAGSPRREEGAVVLHGRGLQGQGVGACRQGRREGTASEGRRPGFPQERLDGGFGRLGGAGLRRGDFGEASGPGGKGAVPAGGSGRDVRVILYRAHSRRAIFSHGVRRPFGTFADLRASISREQGFTRSARAVKTAQNSFSPSPRQRAV